MEGIHVCLHWLSEHSALHFGWIVVSCQASLGTSHFLQKLVYMLIMLIMGHLQGIESKTFHEHQNLRMLRLLV